MISVMHDLKETEVVKNLPVGFQVNQTHKIQQIAYGFSMKPTSISIMMQLTDFKILGFDKTQLLCGKTFKL